MALIHVDKESFDKEVLESDIPVVVDFWAEWCAPCQMLGPIFEELSNAYEGKLKFCKLNTEFNIEVANKSNVNSIPSLVFFNKGKEINRLVGLYNKESLQKKIDSILSSI